MLEIYSPVVIVLKLAVGQADIGRADGQVLQSLYVCFFLALLSEDLHPISSGSQIIEQTLYFVLIDVRFPVGVVFFFSATKSRPVLRSPYDVLEYGYRCSLSEGKACCSCVQVASCLADTGSCRSRAGLRATPSRWTSGSVCSTMNVQHGRVRWWGPAWTASSSARVVAYLQDTLSSCPTPTFYPITQQPSHPIIPTPSLRPASGLVTWSLPPSANF
jgi:hypothetical protein